MTKPIETKYCNYCKKPIERYMSKKGVYEGPKQYATRKFCGKDCYDMFQVRTKSEYRRFLYNDYL